MLNRYLFLIFCPFLWLVSCKNAEETKVSDPSTEVFQYPVGKVDTTSAAFLSWREEIGHHFQKLHRFTNFNGCVLVARQGVVIYEGAFGVKDLKLKEPLALNSVFQIASVSKTFTAMATLLLVEDGRLDLAQPMEDFFDGFPYPGVTVGDLLSHRSGLPNYLSVTEKVWGHQGVLRTNKDLLNFLIEQQPPILALPNRTFCYNNTNYALLALIIEQVSGMPYEEFMQRRIFDPLDMKETYIYSARNKQLPGKNITTGYLRKNHPDDMVPVDGIVGDKNIYSTVGDLLKWERANAHSYLFKQATLDSSVVGRSNERYGSRNYGYGWRMMENSEKGKVVYHNGWWHGYTATFYRNPADETVIIILSNIYNRNTYRIQPVWDILYGKGHHQDLEE